MEQEANLPTVAVSALASRTYRDGSRRCRSGCQIGAALLSVHLQNPKSLTRAHYVCVAVREDPLKRSVLVGSCSLRAVHCTIAGRATHACEKVCELRDFLAEEAPPFFKLEP